MLKCMLTNLKLTTLFYKIEFYPLIINPLQHSEGLSYFNMNDVKTAGNGTDM
jgi:hypothetical protein